VYIYMYVQMYVCIYMCVCVCLRMSSVPFVICRRACMYAKKISGIGIYSVSIIASRSMVYVLPTYVDMYTTNL